MDVLKKLQRNALFEAVAESGLPADDISYESLPALNQYTFDEAWVMHGESNSRFIVRPKSGINEFQYKSWVGDDPAEEENYPVRFEVIVQHMRRWAKEVAKWIDAPDLWGSASSPVTVPGTRTTESENTPFTSDEQAAIAAQLREIKQAVKKTYELTAEQAKHTDEKFEEAEKASRRMGRKDWGLLFGGAVFSLILSDAITPGIAGHILIMVEHGIGHLFMGGPPSVHGILSAGQD